MGRGALGPLRVARLARRRSARPATRLPKVSIHVPAYNEPPDMLIETLDALARLDYPDFEVLVIDNNTRDEAVWRPVEAHCAQLGRALPLLPRRAAGRLQGRRAQLRAARRPRRTPRSSRSSTATTWSSRTGCATWCRASPTRASRSCRRRRTTATTTQSAFKAMCYAEYRGFFHIGMITRNERNAIIQHGTMTHGAPRACCDASSAAGPSGASPRTPSSACASSSRLRRDLRPAQLRPRPDARHLHRLQEAALPLGLRRDADPEGARAHAAGPGRRTLTAGPALPLPRRLAAVDRRRPQPAVQPRRARLVGGDDLRARARSTRRW